jgi:creatinine amidohydrolase
MRDESDILWAEHTRAELPAWAEAGAVVVVPIGSIEQHGLHLPLDTDNRTVEYVARQAARRLGDVPVLVTPTLPIGVSPHHMVYPGTLSLRVSTVLALLEDVCGSIIAHGFERVLILSGHGGNRETIGAAALELRHRLQRQIWAHCWFDLIPQGPGALMDGPCPSIGHSGEAETSAILALAPYLVRHERLVPADGVSDDPAIATAEKGRRLLDAGVEGVMARIKEMAAMDGRRIEIVERYPATPDG